MKKPYFWLIIVILLLAAAAAVALRLASGPEDNWFCTDGNWVKHGHPSAPMPTVYCPGGLPSEDGSVNPAPEVIPEVIIASPAADSLIKSPLIVSGQARGNWFFEATLPVRLITATGEVIASGPGTAQSDWMTMEFVPFTAILNFTTTATSGYLVIAKDNPSGLPENDASLKIPVNFK